MLAYSLNLLVGFAGLFSVAHAAFFGLGAYVTAISTTRGLSFPLDVLLAVVLSSGLSLAVSLPSLRLADDYLAVQTFSFQLVLSSILVNWTSVTGGPLGIPGIPRPRFGSHDLGPGAHALLAAAFLGGLMIVLFRIIKTPFGRLVIGLRESESFCNSLGKDTRRVKIQLFALSCSIASLAGCLYARYLSFIDPTSFSANQSILILAMVIVGGAGTSWGPLLGASLLIGLPELLRLLGLPSVVAGQVRQFLFGFALVATVLLRPSGLLSGRDRARAGRVGDDT